MTTRILTALVMAMLTVFLVICVAVYFGAANSAWFFVIIWTVFVLSIGLMITPFKRKHVALALCGLAVTAIVMGATVEIAIADGWTIVANSPLSVIDTIYKFARFLPTGVSIVPIVIIPHAAIAQFLGWFFLFGEAPRHT